MNQKEKKQDPTLPENRLKFEIAEELGLMDKIRTSGWKGLSSRESGRIGGIMGARGKHERRD
ncbi:MAG: small, acid-soluble spore protein, alpha/beta type [Clostridiales bacterium]|nr:small, acid-soluble spore protein, alpha/beta type [Clostridiales bacterium]